MSANMAQLEGGTARHFVLLELQQGRAVAAADLWVAADAGNCLVVSTVPLPPDLQQRDADS